MKKNIQRITVITYGFPNRVCPYRYTFLEQLVSVVADTGREVNVICPVLVNKKQYYYKKEWSYETSNGKTVRVYQPRIINYSSRKIGRIHLARQTYRAFLNAVRQMIKKLEHKPDALYSHFLVFPGCAAATLGRELGIPAFCASGESDIGIFVDSIGTDFTRKQLKGINGVVSVSLENKRIIREMHLCDESPVDVFPNGVDHSLFMPGDKDKLRKELGIPQDELVGIFVGSFGDVKGVRRVEEAASKVNGLHMIYLGAGDEIPQKGNIIFAGKTSHKNVPRYLAASDFFVLPTKAEGCCNAIIEAMACGLPIVSSDRPFNHDILNSENSILIDPKNISQIELALNMMADDGLRARLARASIETAQGLSLEARASRIINFMENNI